MILEHHWWRTADGSQLVPHGDSRARFLAYTKGQHIADELAKRLGIMPTRSDEDDDAGAGQGQEKQAAKPRNKSAARGGDKAGSGS